MSDRIRRSHRFTQTPEHLTLDPRVSDRAHRLWCRIDRLGEGDRTVPSVREELSIELDCSLSSVDRAITELVSAGWLQVERQPGGESLYTLVVVPERAVLRLIEDARAEREARWKGRRRRYETATASRPVEDRRRGRREPASPQVNEGGVVTHDDGVSSPTTTAGGVVTHDDGVSSPMTTGVVTGDDMTFYRDLEKVTTPLTPQPENGEPTDAAASARVGPTDDGALFDAGPAAPSSGRHSRGRSKVTKEADPRRAKARELVAAWWDALAVKPAGSRTFLNVATLVAEDLAVGRTEDEIAKALRECGVAVTRNALNQRYEAATRTTTGKTSAIRPQGYLADPAADFFAGSTRTA